MRSVCFGCLFTILISTISLARPFVNQPLVPTSVKPGSKGFTLTVNGTDFASTAVLNWNGSPRATSVLSRNKLQATITAADVAKVGTASLTVVNPGKVVSNTVFFTIRKPSESIAMAGKQVFENCSAVAVGDFNNDGILDVAWVSPGSLNVSFGNGKGGFQAPISTLVALPPNFQMITGDFNGDGNLDVAGVDGGGDLEVFLGNGDGTFTQKWSGYVEDAGSFIATADFNQDGNLDLYVTGSELGVQWFQIFLGNGDGTFSLFQTYDINGFAIFAGLAAIGDFNGDGKLDLAVPESSGGTDQVYLGHGDGTFNPFSTFAGGNPQTLATADMNHDGKLDLLDSGCILLGNGNGNFTLSGCGNGGGAILGTGDFNGDGNLDAAFLSTQPSPTMAILLGKGDGTFQNSFAFPAGSGYGTMLGGIGDFNNDGKLDVIAGNGFLLLQTTASLSTTSLAFGNQNVGTTSQPQVVTLTNIGSSSLVIKHVGINGANSKDFAQNNNCGTSLPADSSCNISVTFTPKAKGSRTASLNVGYQGVGSPQSVALSGTGIAASTVSLKPSNLTYATQLVGTTSSPKTATLTNTGGQTVNISNISTSGPFNQNNNCPSSLPVGGNCQIQVTFTPTAGGPASGQLSVTDDAKGSPQITSLSGTGTVVELQPIGVNFGDQKVGTKSQPVPVTLTNVGTTALSISQIGFTGANPGDFSQTNNCGNSVPAGSSCTIKIRFEPKAKGQRSANLAVADDGGASPQTIPVVGTGT